MNLEDTSNHLQQHKHICDVCNKEITADDFKNYNYYEIENDTCSEDYCDYRHAKCQLTKMKSDKLSLIPTHLIKELDRMLNEELKEITAKFDSICFETNRKIKKGEKILWLPGTRKVFCLESKQAEKYFNYKKELNNEDA